MPRKFKTVDYEATLDQTVSIRECLPPEHLAQAETVLQARAEERYQLEQAGYEAQMAERAACQKQSGRKPGEPVPKPPF
jgi:hypothetical protein